MSITIPNNHQQCAVCSKPFFNNDHTLEFALMADGGVIGKIVPTEKVQGYRHNDSHEGASLQFRGLAKPEP